MRTDQLRVYARMRMRVPGASTELMERPRLMQRLDEAAHAKLSLIQAPAGYGKTSLLQQWSRKLVAGGARVAWLTADPADRDAQQFLVSIFHALEEAGHPFAEALRNQITVEVLYSWRVVAAQVANSCIGQEAPLYLAIDDLQQLRGTAALAVLQYLMDNTPPEVRFLLSSREDLGIPLGRLRAIGRVLALGTQDLRFMPEETAEYFVRRGHAPLTPQQLRELEGRAEGWIVGLKLLSMAMHLDPQQDLAPLAVSGEQREIADYFAEDVLAHQPADVQDFMLRTCVLDRLSPALCDGLPGLHDSRALIDRCDTGGLFLISLDHTRDWYRYHALFADFLRRQLQERYPGRTEEICLAASAWHERAGFPAEAFEYALKGRNPIRAAQVLDAQCDTMWSAGRQHVIESLAERLPPHVQALYPRIMLALAWRLVARWKIDQAEQLLAVTRARLQELTFSPGEAPTVRTLQHRALHRETQIAHHLYQLDKVEQLSRQLIEEDAFADDPYTRASVLITLQYALREQFQLADVPRLAELAREAMARTGFSHGLVFHAAMAGPSFLMAGRTRDAARILTEGLHIAQQLSGPGSDLGAVVALHLAQLKYECNELEAARQLIREYFRAEPSAGVMDQLVAGFVTQARLLRLSADTPGALETLEQAAEFAERHLMQRLKRVCNAEQIRLLLRTGHLQEATRLARRAGLTRAVQGPARRGRITSAESAQMLAWCQLAGAQNNLGEALAVARRWRAQVSAAEATFAAIEWGVMLSQLLWLGGDRRAAQRALWHAVAQASPAGIARTFLDGGEPIALILEQMTRGDPRLGDPADSFARHLAQLMTDQHSAGKSAFIGATSPAESGMAGRLTGRELEILVLAGSGMLNKRISEKLGLTEGTVKWYLQQVFDKLGVRDRSRAAAKARHLGLIS